jgi:UDP-N-acetylglucosamine 1-carboxyvinyltransferase
MSSVKITPSVKKLIIEGGVPLKGEITPSGAKNAINKELVASLLTREPCTFRNVPRTTEIDVVLKLLSEVGTKHEWTSENTLTVQTREITNSKVGQNYSGFNRIPILMLGPLLNRVGESCLPAVGGCSIGGRPVDFHIEGLTRMGATITQDGDVFQATTSGLHGATFDLSYPSVGATENLIIAASLANGTTVIRNAAIEPEIFDLILFLQKLGALLSIEPNRTIVVRGVKELSGAEHDVMPDRIEVASLACAAVATAGRVTIRDARQADLLTFLNMLRLAGGAFEVGAHGITFSRDKEDLQAVHLETDVHPGFATDWQPPFAVMLTQAEGLSVIHETVYENRLGYLDELQRLGAHTDRTVACLGRKPCRFADSDYFHSAVIRGRTKLQGKDIRIPDLRAGFSYLIAALVAEGKSTITGLEYLDRGHERLPERLKEIGARVELVAN